MKLTHDDVERILKLLETSAFDALDLEIDGLKLSLRRSKPELSLISGDTIRPKGPIANMRLPLQCSL
jgi:hypothetical protein